MTIDPASGLSRPTSVLRNTDLPVPEGPSITEISPAGSVRVTSFQITWDPNRLVSPSTLISTPTAHLVVDSWGGAGPTRRGRSAVRRAQRRRRPEVTVRRARAAVGRGRAPALPHTRAPPATPRAPPPTSCPASTGTTADPRPIGADRARSPGRSRAGG